MKTKVLLVPTLILFAGFWTINYIKPDFDTYLHKRAERETAKNHSENADRVVSNAMSQKNDLDNNRPKADFLMRFIPQTRDEARALDNFNFLITQSGLITSKIVLQEEVKEENVGAAVFATSDDPLSAANVANIDESGVPITTTAPLYKAPEREEYTVSLEVVGNYQNIKELLKKLAGFDRLHTLKSFKVSATKNGTDGEVAAGTLTATIDLNLPYQPLPKPAAGEAIVIIPSLGVPALNMAFVEKAQTSITDTVPQSVLGTDGKANPFE